MKLDKAMKWAFYLKASFAPPYAFEDGISMHFLAHFNGILFEIINERNQKYRNSKQCIEATDVNDT